MDKYERKVRVNQIISLIDKSEYNEALEIADTIDWRTEKSIRTLRMVSEVYKINRRYEDAFNVLTIAYEKDPDDPIKRKIVYDLCEVAIKLNQYAYAVKYKQEFERLSPNDPGRYVLQYKLLKVSGAEYSERIEVLEEFKKNYFGDFLEKWAYELAQLYHITGQSRQCINACDEIILWFVKGPYVTKAKELKNSYVTQQTEPMSTESGVYPGQEPSYGYDNDMYDEDAGQQTVRPESAPVQGYYNDGSMQIEVENVYASNEPTIRMPNRQINEFEFRQGAEEISVNMDKYSTMNLQAELKANLDDLSEKTGEPIRQREETIPEPDVGMTELFNTQDMSASQYYDPYGQQYAQPPYEEQQYGQPSYEEQQYGQPYGGEPSYQQPYRDGRLSENQFTQSARPHFVGKSDADLDHVGAQQGEAFSYGQQPYVQPSYEEGYAGQQYSGYEEQQTEDGSEERTAEICQDVSSEPEPEKPYERKFPEDEKAEPVVEEVDRAKFVKNVSVFRQSPAEETLYRTEKTQKPTVIKKTDFGESLPRMPQQYRNILSEGYDGQLNMNVPDEPAQLEKQITGQMDLATVLSQWEEFRNESKRRKFATITPTQVSKAQADKEGVHPSRIPKADKTAVPLPAQKELVKVEDPVNEIEVETITPEQLPDEITEIKEPVKEVKEPEAPGKVREIEEKTEFTEDESEIFAPFISIGGMADRLLKVIPRVSMTGSRGNILITGNEATLRIALAKSFATDMQSKNAMMGIKVADIDAEVFNTKDIEKSLKALDGNVLVIKKAGMLSGSTVEKMLEILGTGGLSLLVILEDGKNAVKGLPLSDKQFQKIFSVYVDIPRFTNDDLVQHARDYAREQEYLIDDMAVLALYQRIDEMQTAEHLVTAQEVEEIMDGVIRNVNKKNMSHFMDVLLGKRYDDDDMIIIREKDFEKK